MQPLNKLEIVPEPVLNVPHKRSGLLNDHKASYKNSYKTVFPAYGLNLAEKPVNLRQIPLKFIINGRDLVSKEKMNKHYTTEYNRNLEPTPSEIGTYQDIHHSGILKKMNAEQRRNDSYMLK